MEKYIPPPKRRISNGGPHINPAKAPMYSFNNSILFLIYYKKIRIIPKFTV
jgi:hypothetical protein